MWIVEICEDDCVDSHCCVTTESIGPFDTQAEALAYIESNKHLFEFDRDIFASELRSPDGPYADAPPTPRPPMSEQQKACTARLSKHFDTENMTSDLIHPERNP